MLEQVIGLDHVVVAVRDLDAAARAWQSLGFTCSPRGTHSSHMGTGNYTLMLGDDYLELLGVLNDTERNAPTRQFLAQREGIERAAFTARDAAAGVAELRARGIAATDPVDFERPVTLPDGTVSRAAFTTFNWPVHERPGGVRLFACQHHTRPTVWIPELQQHANGAFAIARIEMLAEDPGADAAHLARLIDRTPQRAPDGAWQLPSGSGRADFVFLDRAQLQARHPGVNTGSLPAQGAAALVLKVRDLGQATRSLRVPFAESAGRVVVDAAHASGLLLVFEAANTSGNRS